MIKIKKLHNLSLLQINKIEERCSQSLHRLVRQSILGSVLCLHVFVVVVFLRIKSQLNQT